MIHAVYSDPHFGHRKVAVEVRGYLSPEVMNEDLIKRYNNVVKPDQTCLWLGDAFLMPYKGASEIMRRLNGVKYLVRGNHDRGVARMARFGFMLVCDELVLSICGRVVRASHYPYWDPYRKSDRRHFRKLSAMAAGKLKQRYPARRNKNEILLHGHIHGTETVYQNMINVSADAWDLAPVKWEQLEELVGGMK